MICPNCRTSVPDDAVICDSCNFIIDTTFLGEGITNQGGSAKPAPPVAQDDGKTKVKAIQAEQDDGRTRVKAIPMAPSVAAAAAASATADAAVGEHYESDEERRRSLSVVAAVPPSVGESIYEISEQYKAFPRSERMTTLAALIFLVSLGFPWRWSEADDAVIGFVAGAWPMGLLALYVIAAPFVRRLPKLRPFKTQFVSGVLGASALVAFGCAFYCWGAVAREYIHIAGRTQQVWKAYPHVGAGIGLLAGICMLGGALGSFLARERLPDA